MLGGLGGGIAWATAIAVMPKVKAKNNDAAAKNLSIVTLPHDRSAVTGGRFFDLKYLCSQITIFKINRSRQKVRRELLFFNFCKRPTNAIGYGYCHARQNAGQ